MQLSPQTIRKLCRGARPLVSPFLESYKDERTNLSGGLTCAGYDVHLGELLKPVKGFRRAPIRYSADPGRWVLPARTGCLGSTMERFILPNDLALHYFNKSTLARGFLNASATLGEPGWEGWLTLELYNNTDRAVDLYIGQPIGQVIFVSLDEMSDSPYAGKYQQQPNHPVEAK